MVSIPNPRNWLSRKIEKQVRTVISKTNYPTVGYGRNPRQHEPSPPYEREINPQWIYKLRENSTLVNNSIEEKVSQTFRRGFTEWEKEYLAKCTQCKEEFQSLEPFKEQLGAYGETLDDNDIDLDSPRICPNCDELSEIKYPSDEDKEEGEDHFRQVNEKTDVQTHLEPLEQNSVGQTFLDVCKEVAWDIQSFDDGWMLFERDYMTDPESGVILDYELKEVHRAPPELMRYSVQENGQFGGEFWICPECRATRDNYEPEREPSDCTYCDGYTYEVYAVAQDEPGGDPDSFYIRGEFVHASEYEPGKYYGFSPILTLWEESRTLEQMDEWYQSAYRERRAPRGAMLIRSSNAESVRAFNKGQMEKLRNDKHYIPTFIDDTEGNGKALEWVNLLEDPAEMQHMEMRNWFLERISAKYGVTPVFQKGSPNNSGLSQSLEIVVSNRSADRLRRIFNTTFIPAFIGQLDIDGWTRELRPVEEEDEDAEADVQSKFLQNATRAEEAGFEYEWTEEDRLKVYPGKPDTGEEGEGGAMPGGGVPGGPPGAGGPGGPQMPSPGPDAGDTPADATGGSPGTPAHQDPRLEQSEKETVTTDTSGWGNARYGQDDEEIDVLGHLQELLEEEEDVSKSNESISWTDIDISDTIRVWIDDPEEAPEKAEVVYDAENGPEDSDAKYYYEERISTTDLGKIDRINKTAEVVDFFWKPGPVGLASLSEITKDENGYTPYEPPAECDRTYLQAVGITESDVAEAQVFEGPQGKKFYCSNWQEVGAWEEGEGPFDPQEPILDWEAVNSELSEGDELDNHERLFEFEDFSEIDSNTDMIVDDGDEWRRLEYVKNALQGEILVKDMDGNKLLKNINNIEDKVQGEIRELETEKYKGRYERYDIPRAIYTPEHTQSKKKMPSAQGGINSQYTRIVEFDNGERGIYKNHPGNSHEFTLDNEVLAYEISNEITDSDVFPETARTDLKNGFGSVQVFIEDAGTVREEQRDGGIIDQSDKNMRDIYEGNAKEIAEMTFIDYLIGNSDRHDDNYMIDEDMNLYAIDNGSHAPPKEDLEKSTMIKPLKHIAQNLFQDDDIDNTNIDDIIGSLVEDIREEQQSMIDEIKDKRERIMETTEEFHGPRSPVTQRVSNALEETDSGKIQLEESIETDLKDAKNYIQHKARSWVYP